MSGTCIRCVKYLYGVPIFSGVVSYCWSGTFVDMSSILEERAVAASPNVNPLVIGDMEFSFPSNIDEFLFWLWPLVIDSMK